MFPPTLYRGWTVWWKWVTGWRSSGLSGDDHTALCSSKEIPGITRDNRADGYTRGDTLLGGLQIDIIILYNYLSTARTFHHGARWGFQQRCVRTHLLRTHLLILLGWAHADLTILWAISWSQPIIATNHCNWKQIVWLSQLQWVLPEEWCEVAPRKQCTSQSSSFNLTSLAHLNLSCLNLASGHHSKIQSMCSPMNIKQWT